MIPADRRRQPDRLSRFARAHAGARPCAALPAHGPVIDDPEHVIRRYIEHRREREAQVLEALAAAKRPRMRSSGGSIAALNDALVPMARESVLAHLLKLEGERTRRRDR